MSAQRLWIFNHHAGAPDSGTGTRHFDLASHLGADRFDVTIFAAGFNHFTGREERLRGWQLKRTEIIDGVRFVWVRTIPYRENDGRRVASMVSYLFVTIIAQLGHAAPTHVIGSTVHPLAALAGYLVARLRGAAFYFEIRDLWPQTLVDLGALREAAVVTRLLRALERFLVSRARAVITVLPGMDLYIRERGLNPRAIAYIPNGVDLRRSAATSRSRAVSRVLELRAAGRFVTIYAGSHALVNRLDVVLDAAANLTRLHSRAHIVLVGDGRERLALQARAAALGLENVDFLGPVPRNEVAALLAESDVCLLHVTDSPVYRFGMSFNKLFDYLASGKPIIFACRAAYDPVAEAECGLSIAPDDADSLADAIRRLEHTPIGEREAMGRNGVRWVTEHHDMAMLAHRLSATLAA